jgi:hypothetical protein
MSRGAERNLCGLLVAGLAGWLMTTTAPAQPLTIGESFVKEKIGKTGYVTDRHPIFFLRRAAGRSSRLPEIDLRQDHNNIRWA